MTLTMLMLIRTSVAITLTRDSGMVAPDSPAWHPRVELAYGYRRDNFHTSHGQVLDVKMRMRQILYKRSTISKEFFMSNVLIQINSPSVVGEVLDNEAVIINLGTGAYYSLNSSGSLLWTRIEHGTTRSDLLATLRNQYDVSEELAARHIDHFLVVLQDETLIVTGEGDLSPRAALPAAAGKLTFEPPQLMKYTDMQELILLDPIHDVDEKGWPHIKQA